MSRYRQFHDEDQHSSAILPEIELEEIDRVEVRSPAKRSSRFGHCLTRRTRLEVILLLSLFVLFVSLLVVVLIENPSRGTSVSFCLSVPCVDLASSILSSMNRSVDPCDDFHQFVCGRWMRTHLIPKGHPSWSMMKVLSEKNLIVLKSLLDDVSTGSSNELEAQAKRFYRSCLNLTELERLHHQPIDDYLHQNLNWSLNEWRNLSRNATHVDLYVRISTFLNIQHGISVLLPIDVSADEKNSSWYTVHVRRRLALLSLDERSFGSVDHAAAVAAEQSRLLRQFDEQREECFGDERRHVASLDERSFLSFRFGKNTSKSARISSNCLASRKPNRSNACVTFWNWK